MKEFEFDDIVVSDENEVNEPINEPKKEDNSSDSLYQKFSFDIDTAEEKKVEKPNVEEVSANDIFGEDVVEETDINNLFEEKEEKVEEKPLFSNSNEEIDNPFTNVEPKEEEKVEVEEENIFEEANKEEKTIISFDEKEIENKEDALEEALSHTTKLTPFKEEKPKVEDLEIEEAKEGKESNGIAYLIILFIILLLAIFVIPKIASLLVIK